MAGLMALGTEDPPPLRELNPAVPEPLAELIHQMLAKKPDARPQSAGEVAMRVRAIADGVPLFRTKPRKVGGSRRRRVATFAAVLAIVVCGAVLIISRRDGTG